MKKVPPPSFTILDSKAILQGYRDQGVPISRKGRRLSISDPEGHELDDCLIDDSLELLTSNGFRIYAGMLLAKAAGSDFMADGQGLDAKWKMGPHNFLGNGFYLENSGFHYEVQVEDGTIPWKEEWYFSKWPTQKQLLERQEHLIQSFESTIRLLAYLASKGISNTFRDRKFLLGPLTVSFDGHALRVESKGADLAASLAALGGLVDFVTPPASKPTSIFPMEVEIELR